MSTVQGFISYDTPDGLGIRAQVVVTKGELPIKRITLNDAETMAKIDFDAEAGGLKFPIHANVPVDSPAYEVLKAAKESKEPVSFRIESQRKKGIDRRLAFPPAKDSDRVAGEKYLETQGGKEVVKKLVAAGEIVTHEQRTDVDEDARWASIDRASAPAFLDANPAAAVVAGAGLDPQVVLSQYVAAVQADLPQEMTRIIGALAIASGASVDDFFEAARKATAA